MSHMFTLELLPRQNYWQCGSYRSKQSYHHVIIVEGSQTFCQRMALIRKKEKECFIRTDITYERLIRSWIIDGFC